MGGGGTANQLNFAAVKFCGLPIYLYFALFNFAFWYLRTKNVPSQKCPLFMVQFFEPTCANARWALMRHFASVRLSVCLSVTGQKFTGQ